MQKIIPMTKATGLGPLPTLLEQRVSGRALHRVFRRENVPMEVLENREIRMPLVSMMGLFEKSAREAGSRTFGLSVGNDMSHGSFGMWLVYSASGATLGEALRRTAITVRFQQSGSKLVVVRRGNYVIWRYIIPHNSEISIQHADHVLGPMMKFVRSFLGARWQPEWVELNYQRDTDAHLLERELHSPVHFGCPGVGIAIRLDQLAIPNQNIHATASPKLLTLLEVEASESANRFEEPIQSLFSIVVLRLLDGKSDVEGTAQMAGLGVQTLQRRLRCEGVTYRGLVQAARQGKACALLRETSLNVTEIAFGLGYSDHANFTRAFGRWMGCSPSEYRKATVAVT
ncbi:MAG: AraC family transcriptional regulator ligand-binding domain-containing protein [Paracoccaceae bacterium]